MPFIHCSKTNSIIYKTETRLWKDLLKASHGGKSKIFAFKALSNLQIDFPSGDAFQISETERSEERRVGKEC